MGADAWPPQMTTGAMCQPGRWRKAPRHLRTFIHTTFADTCAGHARTGPRRPSEARTKQAKAPEPVERIPTVDDQETPKRAVPHPEDTDDTAVTGGLCGVDDGHAHREEDL